MAEHGNAVRGVAGRAFRVLSRRYFWIHMSIQSVCATCFLAGSILTLFEATKLATSWVYLAGSLTFAALPAVRLLNRKAQSVLSRDH